jgi:predicted nuclease of predicted toxin-antitoxin system
VKIVADESVDKQIVDRLRVGGHSVVSIAELEPGVDDETVLARSREHHAVLVTADKDLGELWHPAYSTCRARARRKGRARGIGG